MPGLNLRRLKLDDKTDTAIDRELYRLGELSRKFWLESRAVCSRMITNFHLSKADLQAAAPAENTTPRAQRRPNWQDHKAAA